MRKDKCCVKYCRAEPWVVLPDFSRLCKKHFDESCDEEEEQYEKQKAE